MQRPLGQNNVQDICNKLSKTETAVLEIIKADNTLTAKQIAERIGKTDKTVYRAIRILREKNYIVRKGNDFDGVWIVNN